VSEWRLNHCPIRGRAVKKKEEVNQWVSCGIALK
jgi:hypothetical protein